VSSPPAACASERAFSVHIRRRAGRRLVRVSMWLAGRKLHVGARGGRWTAQVDLRGRAPGTYTLQIRAKTAAGRWITGKRRYRTCVDRLPYDTPPL
jgi:hypothetical protein